MCAGITYILDWIRRRLLATKICNIPKMHYIRHTYKANFNGRLYNDSCQGTNVKYINGVITA